MAADVTEPQQRIALTSQCLWLAMVAAVAVLLLAGPAWLVGGEPAVRGLIVAFALCLPPGCIAVCAAGLCRNVGLRLPVVVLAGMVLRLLFVSAGVIALKQAGGSLTLLNFTVWVLLAYLTMLAAETWLVLRYVQQSEGGLEPAASTADPEQESGGQTAAGPASN